ncbi:nuclear transcription factor Y subunit B-9-like [Pistacia vera]|uniref:nuclear transcription factor Y subunit B-9-like n=1 Tax=Pistacia vera TaxID=55513 RepID=UPI001262EECD|nr:nuclear transcription factor Y subunit B-9-like [Pistacia vera]
MERQAGFNNYPNKLPRPSSSDLVIHPRNGSNPVATTPATTSLNTVINNNNITKKNNNNNNSIGQQQAPQPPPCVIREQDQYMPIANVIRIMRRILPPHAKISDDAKETVQECVSEYISFITGEANERCHREQRKTITAEDVIWAMGKLGFDNYVEPLTLFLSRYRESETDRTSTHKEPILRHGMIDYGPMGLSGPYGPVFNMGPQQGFFDPMIGGYFRDGSGSGSGSGSTGGSSSQANLPAFDPFSQFK